MAGYSLAANTCVITSSLNFTVLSTEQTRISDGLRTYGPKHVKHRCRYLSVWPVATVVHPVCA